MIKLYRSLATLIVLLLTSCAYMPSGPSRIALAAPGLDKSFDQFHNDDMKCKQFSQKEVSEISANKTSAWIVQQHYDFRYLQCMYAQGHRVPID